MAPRSLRKPSKPVSYLKGLMISFFVIVLLLGLSNVGLFVNRRTTTPVVEVSPIPGAVAPLNQTFATPALPALHIPSEPAPWQESQPGASRTPYIPVHSDVSLPPKANARVSRRPSVPSRLPDDSTRAAPIRKPRVAPAEAPFAVSSSPSTQRQNDQKSQETSASTGDDVAWCLQAKKRYNVQPGSSWGRYYEEDSLDLVGLALPLGL